MVLPHPPLGEASKRRLGAARALVVFRKGAFTLDSLTVGIRVTRYLRYSKTKWLTAEPLVLLSIRFLSVHSKDGAFVPQITDRSVILESDSNLRPDKPSLLVSSMTQGEHANLREFVPGWVSFGLIGRE